MKISLEQKRLVLNYLEQFARDNADLRINLDLKFKYGIAVFNLESTNGTSDGYTQPTIYTLRQLPVDPVIGLPFDTLLFSLSDSQLVGTIKFKENQFVVELREYPDSRVSKFCQHLNQNILGSAMGVADAISSTGSVVTNSMFGRNDSVPGKTDGSHPEKPAPR